MLSLRFLGHVVFSPDFPPFCRIGNSKFFDMYCKACISNSRPPTGFLSSKPQLSLLIILVLISARFCSFDCSPFWRPECRMSNPPFLTRGPAPGTSVTEVSFSPLGFAFGLVGTVHRLP